jgi:integrase
MYLRVARALHAPRRVIIMAGQRRQFGALRKLPSGRWQAKYRGPDGRVYTAPTTYDAKGYAEAWLARVFTDIQAGTWVSPNTPTAAVVTLGSYAEAWLADRDLKPRTRVNYQRIFDRHIAPTFADMPVTSITVAHVRTWHAALSNRVGATTRAHAYSLLRTIMGTVVSDDMRDSNPCRIHGAGTTKRAKQIRPLTIAELDALVAEMPDRYQLMTLVSAWCGLRFGEITELRRSDVDLTSGVLRVRRAVTRPTGGSEVYVDTPKSDAGKRDVAVPPHIMPALEEHVRTLVGDALLFPAADGRHLAPSSLWKVFRPARARIGRPDLRWHDLRHTGAVLAAATGATLAELMARLGHSTPSAAMIYQHAAADRDRVIADALSELAVATVVPIRNPAAS